MSENCQPILVRKINEKISQQLMSLSADLTYQKNKYQAVHIIARKASAFQTLEQASTISNSFAVINAILNS